MGGMAAPRLQATGARPGLAARQAAELRCGSSPWTLRWVGICVELAPGLCMPAAPSHGRALAGRVPHQPWLGACMLTCSTALHLALLLLLLLLLLSPLLLLLLLLRPDLLRVHLPGAAQWPALAVRSLLAAVRLFRCAGLPGLQRTLLLRKGLPGAAPNWLRSAMAREVAHRALVRLPLCQVLSGLGVHTDSPLPRAEDRGGALTMLRLCMAQAPAGGLRAQQGRGRACRRGPAVGGDHVSHRRLSVWVLGAEDDLQAGSTSAHQAALRKVLTQGLCTGALCRGCAEQRHSPHDRECWLAEVIRASAGGQAHTL